MSPKPRLAKLVLIACGSFNPITRMHLEMFHLAKQHLDQHQSDIQFVKGIFSPVGDQYFLKKGKLVKASDRIQMIQLAIKQFNAEHQLTTDNNYLHVDTWESSQPDWQRTLHVLQHFESQLNNSSSGNSGNDSPVHVKLLCGADLLLSMTDPVIWKEQDIRDILCNYGLVVVNRDGIDVRSVIGSSSVLKECSDHIDIVHAFAGNTDSSTKARQAISRGEFPNDLIFDKVYDYIQEKGLYRE